MTTLHLGVLDIPYGKAGSKTTHDVAMILEAKYGLFSQFVAMHEAVIAHNIANGLEGYLESALMGAPIEKNAAFAAGMSDIETDFRDAIDNQVYDFKIPGVPTAAAIAGVRHSLKRPYAGGRARGPRASFFDTGLLSSSMRAWID